jgi:hypothetical protein
LIRQFHTYSNPGRDPRHHTVSTIFIASASGKPTAGDDAKEVGIFTKDLLPKDLAFDHRQILSCMSTFCLSVDTLAYTATVFFFMRSFLLNQGAEKTPLKSELLTTLKQSIFYYTKNRGKNKCFFRSYYNSSLMKKLITIIYL